MHLHEYQAKELLHKAGVPIPDYHVVSSIEDVKKFLKSSNWTEAVVKIQVHAGGRGKAGGVKRAKGEKEILSTASALLGMKMVNEQTGKAGVIAHQLLLTKPVDIKKEYYLAAVIDRELCSAYLIASPEGGVEIEEIAAKSPEKILKVPIQLDGTIRPYHLLRFVSFMGFKGVMEKAATTLAKAVAKSFIHYDAALLEINPLIETSNHELFALDAKMTIDDNALFRQSEICSFYDPTQVSQGEAEARQFDLSYISLDGNIGCMVNGAGLAMATMDVIQLFGGSPANFLDVGGGATKEKVAEGFRIILEDPKVEAILVNIFGGIMNCATIAEGIIDAARQLNIHVPLVVRLEGTNVEEGKRLLTQSGLSILSATSLADAAEKAVTSVKRRRA